MSKIIASLYCTGAPCCATAEFSTFQTYSASSLEIYRTSTLHSADEYKHMWKQFDTGETGAGYGAMGRFFGIGDTAEEAYRNALTWYAEHVAEVYDHEGVQVRYLWFRHDYEYESLDDYDGDEVHFREAELRTIIKDWPGVVHLGTIRNANTGNILDGYMIAFHQPEEKDNW